MPDFKKFLEKARQDLFAIMPSYFSIWDEGKEKVASNMFQYIQSHHEQVQLERGDRYALDAEPYTANLANTSPKLWKPAHRDSDG